MIPGRIRLHPSDRHFHILDAGRIGMLGRETIVDREPGKARLLQWRMHRSHVALLRAAGLVARVPAAAMHEYNGGERTSAVRHVSIELEALARSGAVLNVGL